MPPFGCRATSSTVRSSTILGGLATALLSSALAAGTVPAVTPSPAFAQSNDDARRKLEANKKVLEETRQREQELQRDVGSLEAEKTRINRNLIDTAKAIQRAEGKLTQIEERLGELEAQEKLVRGSLVQNQGKIAKLLAAMQRMGRNPPPVMVTRREDALEMVRSAMLLASVFPEMREQALMLSEKLNEMARVMGEIRTEGEQLKAETTRLSDARMRLDALLVTKRETITERQTEIKQLRQAAAELAQSVTDINEFITKIDKAVAEKAGIAEYDRELAESRAAGQQGVAEREKTAEPAGPSKEVAQAPPMPAPAPAPEVRARAGDRMAAEGGTGTQQEAGKPADSAVTGRPPERVAMVVPKPMRPTVPFDRTKGALAYPAAGRRVVGFGEHTEVGATSKGIVIETRAGAQITSPSDGWVVFAGEFRSYGQLLIINCGGGYHIVLAGLTRIDATVGQFVLAGEPVGAMGAVGGTVAGIAPGSAGRAGAKPNEAPPVLYVEFRKDGRPFDSGSWWAPEGSKKVQG